jgi:hypothetical protein
MMRAVNSENPTMIKGKIIKIEIEIEIKIKSFLKNI